MRYYFSEIKANDSAYEIQFIVPGFKKNEITLSATPSYLYVAARNKTNLYSDKIKLNSSVDIENITSKLEDGILYITVPKKTQEAKSLSIEIK